MLQSNYSENHEPRPEQLDLEPEKVTLQTQSLNFDFQTELENLEETILAGNRIPLTELIIINEQLLLDRLDIIKENLPNQLATAITIVNRRQEIIAEAEKYALELTRSAREKATKIIHESAIVRQAEIEAAKIEIQTEDKCEQLLKKTKAEIKQWRENAIAECQAIQMGADCYADEVLGNMEQQLLDMLAVIKNGRQQLNNEQ